MITHYEMILSWTLGDVTQQFFARKRKKEANLNFVVNLLEIITRKFVDPQCTKVLCT